MAEQELSIFCLCALKAGYPKCMQGRRGQLDKALDLQGFTYHAGFGTNIGQ